MAREENWGLFLVLGSLLLFFSVGWFLAAVYILLRESNFFNIVNAALPLVMGTYAIYLLRRAVVPRQRAPTI